MIGQALKTFTANGVRSDTYAAVEKALSGKSLTKTELERYTSALGTSKYFDKEGNHYTEDEAKAKYNSDENLKSIYGTE
jgi:hypothetical protein